MPIIRVDVRLKYEEFECSTVVGLQRLVPFGESVQRYRQHLTEYSTQALLGDRDLIPLRSRSLRENGIPPSVLPGYRCAVAAR